jgi:hypothetical protein
MLEQQQRRVLCDAHVHHYDCFDGSTLLDAAFANLQAVAGDAGIDAWDGVLMLSETASDHWFRTLSDNAGTPTHDPGGWTISATSESASLAAARTDGASLTIVAGRQVISAENLEILHLATSLDMPDGSSADEIVREGRAGGCIVVAPWGFGKWWGARGRLMDRLLEDHGPDELLLGDNSGRPWCLPEPRQFRAASMEGRAVLPGSDPLPFAGEERRVAKVGFILDHALDLAAPAADLCRCLTRSGPEITPFMHKEGLLRFARNQVGMQLRKRHS